MKVSIIIPVFNTQEFVGVALNSALAQTHKDVEVIVVDDCGSDESMEVVRSFSDERVKIISNGTNRGSFYARINALLHATGEFVTCLDSDDILEPNAVEIFVKTAQKTGADFVACSLKNLHEDGTTESETQLKAAVFENFSDYANFRFRTKETQHSICGKFVRREVFLRAVSLLDKEQRLSMCEDGLLNFAIFCFAKSAANLSEALYCVRVRQSSITKVRTAERLEAFLRDYELVLGEFVRLRKKVDARIFVVFYEQVKFEIAKCKRDVARAKKELGVAGKVAFLAAKVRFLARRALRVKLGV